MRAGLVIGSVVLVVVVISLLVTVIARRKGYDLGGNTIVRCSMGHLFTTVWVPGASLKAVRLGWARFQRCPVGRHWSLVKPVKASELSEEERQMAAANHDVRLP